MTNSNARGTKTEIFHEVQYFWQQPLSWFVWIITGGSIVILNNIGAIHTTFAYVMIVLVAGLLVLVTFTNLVTEISRDGISYRMWPFHSKSRILGWDEIETIELRKYRPIGEYGGWGVRIGSNGKAYNVKGNMGIQLTLTDGKRILIGTQKPEDVQEVLRSLGH